MSLQFKVKDLEGIDESVQSLYEKAEDGYQLKVEGMPEVEDVSGLKSALEKEREKRRQAILEREEAAEKARQVAEEKARKSGDLEALEKSWEQKYNKLQQDLETEKKDLLGVLENNTIHATAMELATSNAVQGSAKVLLPAFEGRIGMEFREGKAVPVVLDAEGKPSAMSVDELVEEVRNDPAYAPVIVASKATGGGATGGKGGGTVQKRGDMAGSKDDQLAAIRSKFPELAN
jgi:dsDNA-specific endonuclease/ATPase MutS2